MIMRASNFPTFFLSLIGSVAFRIAIRFLSSVLTLRRIAARNKVIAIDWNSTKDKKPIVAIATAVIEQQRQDDTSLPCIECKDEINEKGQPPESQIKLPSATIIAVEVSEQVIDAPHPQSPEGNEHQIFVQDAIMDHSVHNDPEVAVGDEIRNTIAIKSARHPESCSVRPSLYQSVARAIETKLPLDITNSHSTKSPPLIEDVTSKQLEPSPGENIPQKPKRWIILEIIEQAITILNLDNRTVESIGLDSIASMTSDNFAKLTATVISYILLGTNPSWSSCNGSLSMTIITIEFVCAILVTLLIEVPYTIYESRDIGYDLVE
ncbi:hypothetical protein HDU76_009185, partial [Blyttiomyces sp. JEL0837]